ncbi:MAG: 23S rRNA (uracil(1939)-C(5))-methyltransferase RlmD [Nitrospirae bacterium]|nr:MAG: 23S rRNA (uracil-5-)-methyltransferase RumA [Nitrospirae bacterium 13_2_20CM_2_62_8]TLY42038.1 MAG: 23S rRNA (uracil(1939)-C(5))-methyltransferase RlmD [Nitrospirota bacterium]
MADETLTVTIEKLVQGGRGLARREGKVLLVRGAIPGETVAVTNGVQHKGFQEATVSEVLIASPDRVTPPCPVYEVCGGCQFQHIRYEAQLLEKAAILKETLSRVGRLAVETMPPVIPSPDPYGYRSAIRFVVFRDRAGFALGFHREGTNQPVAAACCLLVPEPTRAIAAALGERLAQRAKPPLRLESVEIRRSVAFGSTLLLHRTGPAKREQADTLFEQFQDIPDVVGQVLTAGGEGKPQKVKGKTGAIGRKEGRERGGQRWQRFVDGQEWIADRLGDLIFRISDRSSMQANWLLNETLSRTVSDWVAPTAGLRVLELFAGIGTLGLPLARAGALVTEAEANAYALADARHAAKTNHVGRSRFRSLRAEAMLQATQAEEYDVVIVDPPRTGVSRECLQELLRLQVGRVLYLSCDPATLARDLSRLCDGGYRIARLQPFDMFPQTSHLETLVELVR